MMIRCPICNRPVVKFDTSGHLDRERYILCRDEDFVHAKVLGMDVLGYRIKSAEGVEQAINEQINSRWFKVMRI